MTTTSTSSTTVQAAPSLTGISHVGLTVRDVTTSEAWYADVLGLVRVFVEPHSAGEGYAVVMTRPGTALFLGLDHHPDADRQEFSEHRTGLDGVARLRAQSELAHHVDGFSGESRPAEERAAHLQDGPIRERMKSCAGLELDAAPLEDEHRQGLAGGHLGHEDP